MDVGGVSTIMQQDVEFDREALGGQRFCFKAMLTIHFLSILPFVSLFLSFSSFAILR